MLSVSLPTQILAQLHHKMRIWQLLLDLRILRGHLVGQMASELANVHASMRLHRRVTSLTVLPILVAIACSANLCTSHSVLCTLLESKATHHVVMVLQARQHGLTTLTSGIMLSTKITVRGWVHTVLWI